MKKVGADLGRGIKHQRQYEVIHQCKLHLSAIFIYLFVYYNYQPGRSFYLAKTFSKFLSRFEGLCEAFFSRTSTNVRWNRANKLNRYINLVDIMLRKD